MNINVKIEAPGLVEAIRALAAAMGGVKVTTVNSAQETPTPVQQPETNQQNNVPTGVPVQTPPALDQSQQQTPPQNATQVPTAAVSYTQEQLAVAASSLLDAGKSNELVSLLASFGVQALTQLPQEHYGAFATKLRELGAQL